MTRRKKQKLGGKGVGRLICLKAFQKILIESIYFEDNSFKIRKFHYIKSKEGFDQYMDDIATTKINTGTSALLLNYESKYQKQAPRQIIEIGRQIITHFQLYFIQKIEPEIILTNQNNVELNLTSLFSREFQNEILEKSFEISNQKFRIFISKSFKAKSYKIHYCTHERNVKDEGLSKYLEDLKFKIGSESEEGFYFHVFIVGNYLNENVNEARTGFNFSLEDDSEEIDFEEITLSKIRKGAIACIEELLSDFLQ